MPSLPTRDSPITSTAKATLLRLRNLFQEIAYLLRGKKIWRQISILSHDRPPTQRAWQISSPKLSPPLRTYTIHSFLPHFLPPPSFLPTLPHLRWPRRRRRASVGVTAPGKRWVGKIVRKGGIISAPGEGGGAATGKRGGGELHYGPPRGKNGGEEKREEEKEKRKG